MNNTVQAMNNTVQFGNLLNTATKGCEFTTSEILIGVGVGLVLSAGVIALINWLLNR